jgi:hypothetical protein
MNILNGLTAKEKKLVMRKFGAMNTDAIVDQQLNVSADPRTKMKSLLEAKRRARLGLKSQNILRERETQIVKKERTEKKEEREERERNANMLENMDLDQLEKKVGKVKISLYNHLLEKETRTENENMIIRLYQRQNTVDEDEDL